MQRVAPKIETVGGAALKRPHEARTDQREQRPRILLRNRIGERLAHHLESRVRLIGRHDLDLDLRIGKALDRGVGGQPRRQHGHDGKRGKQSAHRISPFVGRRRRVHSHAGFGSAVISSSTRPLVSMPTRKIAIAAIR